MSSVVTCLLFTCKQTYRHIIVLNIFRNHHTYNRKKTINLYHSDMLYNSIPYSYHYPALYLVGEYPMDPFHSFLITNIPEIAICTNRSQQQNNPKLFNTVINFTYSL